LAGAAHARADVIVGGITFNDNAFADRLASSTGAWSFGGGATSLENALVGSNPDDFAFAFGSTSNVVLQFTDNLAINLAGADLAVFELGTAETFSLAVTVGGTTQSYTAVSTGFTAGGFELLVAQIDLSDFGVALGGTVDTVQLFPAPTGGDPADFTVVAALNNTSPTGVVPGPSTLGLLSMGAGVSLIYGWRRRRNLAVASC
jgi:hypothetical protein